MYDCTDQTVDNQRCKYLVLLKVCYNFSALYGMVDVLRQSAWYPLTNETSCQVEAAYSDQIGENPLRNRYSAPMALLYHERYFHD